MIEVAEAGSELRALMHLIGLLRDCALHHASGNERRPRLSNLVSGKHTYVAAAAVSAPGNPGVEPADADTPRTTEPPKKTRGARIV